MASSATELIERPVVRPVARAAGALLDRLFTPHGPAAYLRWVRPAAQNGSEAGELRRDGEVDANGTEARARAARRSADGGTGRNPMSTGAEVTFARSGLTAVAEGSLLETAEAAGLAPRNRCRRGICGTCTTPKLGGTVIDARTGETSEEPGPIRICVSVAQGDVALDL